MDDVIVVGAGPAGNNAALGLASKGFAVTVIDSRCNIGEKLCTGIVGQECTSRFPIDPSLVYHDASSINVIAPSTGHVRFESAFPRARIIDRAAYVASFASQAQAAGASYVLGQRVLQVTPAANGVIVSTDSGNYQGRSLVLAAGFGSHLTRQLGLGSVSDYVTGAQAQVSTNGVSEVEVFLGNHTAPGFFAWLVPTEPGQALAGLLGRRHAHAHLGNFIDRQRNEGKITGITTDVARWGIPLRPLRRTYLDRVLVVGDAAGQVKPTTGGGIYYALLASEIASQALAETLADDDLSAERLRRYQRRWKELLSRELEVGYSARRLFEALNDQQISSLVRQAGASGVRYDLVNAPDTSFDWHSRIIGKIVGHPVLGGALRLINPLLSRLAHPSDPSFTSLTATSNRPDPLADPST